MKAKKKPLGMKQRIREERKREERVGLAAVVAILIIMIFVSGFFVNSLLNQPSASQTASPKSEPSEPKAAIVDHLSLTYPNQTFINTATNTLKQAGYAVDYYPGEQVTVEFYRRLPTHSYRIIILRVHSTATMIEGTEAPLALFTSEGYSQTKYVYEQLADQIVAVSSSPENREETIRYFGIRPLFVSQSMKGMFQNTVIVMMGCEGLDNPEMAKAFIEQGAKSYIGWSGSVLASHTDTAIVHLLQHFLIEKLTLKESLKQTFKNVGFDPAYKSLLLYYPLEAGDYTIQQ